MPGGMPPPFWAQRTCCTCSAPLPVGQPYTYSAHHGKVCTSCLPAHVAVGHRCSNVPAWPPEAQRRKKPADTQHRG